MQSIRFYMVEGEYIVSMWTELDFLFIKTNLDRVFKSTNTPVENIDFIEVKH